MSVQFISTNKNYKRLYASPLDPSISWNTEEEMLNYLTDPTCYANQIMGCNGRAYIVVEVDGVKSVREIGDSKDSGNIIDNEEFIKVKELSLSNKENIDTINSTIENISEEISDTNNKLDSKFDDVIVDTVNSVTKLVFMSDGNEIKNVEFESGSGVGVDNRLSIGEEEPVEPSEELLVWIDTSNNDDAYTGGLEDVVIEEFREVFNYLKEKITTLERKNLDLEARIIYLEENGSSGGGTVKPDNPTNPSDNTVMTFEDGSILIDEDGNILVF